MNGELDLEREAEFGAASGGLYVETHQQADLFTRSAQPVNRYLSPFGAEQLDQTRISLPLDKDHVLVIHDSVHQIHWQEPHLEGTQGIMRLGETKAAPSGSVGLQKPIEQNAEKQETDDDGQEDLDHWRVALMRCVLARSNIVRVSRARYS